MATTTQATPAASSTPAPSILMYFLFGLCILNICGLAPGIAQIGRGVEEGAEAGSSLFVQISLALVGIVGVCGIAGSPVGLRVMQRCWPLLLLPLIAVASTVWSVDPSLTLRRGISYLCSVLLAIGMVATLGPWASIKLSLRMAGVIMVLCVVWVVVFPDLGVHTATEGAQSLHAGLWRGLFSHKVSLGQHAGLVLGFMVFYAAQGFGSPISLGVYGIATLLCLVNSGAATGLVAAAVLIGCLYAARWIGGAAVWARPSRLTGVLLVGFSAAFVLMLVWDVFMSRVLGRSGDLTGRTQLWEAVWNFLGSNLSPFSLGYGYIAGFRNYVGPQISEVLEITYPDSHSGYIDTIVAFGYPLAMVVFAVHALILLRALRVLSATSIENAAIAAFAPAFLVTFFVMNYAESHIMSQLGVTNVLFNVAAAISCAVGVAGQRVAAPRRAPSRPSTVGVGAPAMSMRDRPKHE